MTRLSLHILLLLVGVSATAQQTSQLYLAARPSKTTIRLRWSVSDALGWQIANQYGYVIERYTVMEGGKVLTQRVKRILTPTPIMPAVLPDWEAHMDNDYVAVAAQAIHGERFELDENTSEMAQMINQAQELENRFSFLMYAADQSVKAAELSGLYFEDEEVSNGQKYLYNIYSLVPSAVHLMDTASVYVGLEDYYDLPAPKDVEVSFGDKAAMVSWNKAIYQSEYNAFWVERSDDGGKTFQRLTKTPFVPMQKKRSPALNARAFKTDSLSENNKTYYYRVIGINAFGELSIPSDTVGGTGLPVFTEAPIITHHDLLEDGQVRLHWNFPDKQKHLLKNFDLYRENKQLKQHEPIVLGLQASDTVYLDTHPHSSNYYLLRSNDIHGRYTTSLPYFVQLEDSIPPVVPVGLSGTIDTLGIVHLSWEPNAEPDLFGYRLFKANYAENEFVQVDGPVITTNKFTDTLDLKTLHEEIHYKILALDNRFNPSAYSEPVLLKKPDLIPPVSPVFTTITNEPEGIALTWEFSSSADVVDHLLYRQSEQELDWSLLKAMGQGTETLFYLDKEVEHNTQYAYTMIAVDDDGLESDPAIPVVATRLKPDAYPPITNIHYLTHKEKGELQISWDYGERGVEKFLVYKASGDASFQLYKSLQAQTRELTEKVTPGMPQIKYKVIAVMANGYRSKMSEELIIKMN